LSNRTQYPVVDACIAFCAKGESKSEDALVSFHTLEAIKNNKKILVIFCKKLQQEWGDKPNLYSKRWLASMFSSKRIKLFSDEKLKNSLTKKINNSVPSNFSAKRRNMIKDIHIFCAAIGTDSIIISFNDAEARDYKRFIRDARIQNIAWVNPLKFSDIISWIENGLPIGIEMRLANINFH